MTYSPPQLFRVELDYSQAILSACSLTTMSMSTGQKQFCRFNCKSHGSMNMSDLAGRAS